MFRKQKLIRIFIFVTLLLLGSNASGTPCVVWMLVTYLSSLLFMWEANKSTCGFPYLYCRINLEFPRLVKLADPVTRCPPSHSVCLVDMLLISLSLIVEPV